MDLLIPVELIDELADDHDLIPFVETPVKKIADGPGQNILDGLQQCDGQQQRCAGIQKSCPPVAAEHQGNADGIDDQQVLQSPHPRHPPHGFKDRGMLGLGQSVIPNPKPYGHGEGYAGQKNPHQPSLLFDRVDDFFEGLKSDKADRQDHRQPHHDAGCGFQAAESVSVFEIGASGHLLDRVQGQAGRQSPRQRNHEIGHKDDGVGRPHADNGSADRIGFHRHRDGQQLNFRFIGDRG